MKNTQLAFSFLTIILLSFSAKAQINLGEKALGALQNGVAALTFSDADAAKLSLEAVTKMDAENKVAPSTDGYAIRLARVFGKHKSENGMNLNYKVYLTKDVNAFATADGSVRVFSGLMDIMDDNQLLAVIGHEIGHVANHDSRDGMKAAYKKAFVIGAVSSQSDKIAALSESQLGQIGSAMIDSKHSRTQESEADDYSYEFMKRNKYDVNAVESAFNILASDATSSDFLTRMLSSHPDPKDRAAKAKARAQKDGLYKSYVQKTISNKAIALKTITKKTTKKTTKKK